MGPTQPPVQGLPGFFLGVNWSGQKVNHSSLSSAKVKKEWICTSAPVICFPVVGRESRTVVLSGMGVWV